MIAQRHGVIGKVAVHVRQQGPLVHAVIERALKLVAGVQGQHIVPGGPGLTDGRRDPAIAAPAAGLGKGGIAVGVDARHMGVGIVHMQDDELQSVWRAGPLLDLPRRAAGQGQHEARKTEKERP